MCFFMQSPVDGYNSVVAPPYSYPLTRSCVEPFLLLSFTLFLIRFRRCVHYGVLPAKQAAKLFKIVTKRKKEGKSVG